LEVDGEGRSKPGSAPPPAITARHWLPMQISSRFGLKSESILLFLAVSVGINDAIVAGSRRARFWLGEFGSVCEGMISLRDESLYLMILEKMRANHKRPFKAFRPL
jgi:hypothetical protein